MKLQEGEYAFVASAARSQQFPVGACDLLSEVLVFEVLENLKNLLLKQGAPVKKEVLEARLAAFESSYEMRRAASCGGSIGLPSE